ncbi:SCO family protein [Membranihabitans marinus]|uniref:SCO family protein n=1 Tax=Membranihabitans marinus TaxID=1227546 RepID=UPI001F1D64C1|nr:SCO family protein [Membranihabitans marinus]
MNSKTKIFNTPIKVYVLLCLSYLIMACGQKDEAAIETYPLPYYNQATFTPHWMSEDDSRLDSFHQISPFQLINQDGEKIDEDTFKDKIYVADFFFTACPGICPKMTANMAVVQDSFIHDDEVLIISHSVTPSRDSVSILKTYAEEKGVVSNKWHLVTGEKELIYKLGRQDYFVEEDLGLQKDINDFLHTENFVLVDKNKHIRGIYNGLNKTSTQQLIADIKTLKLEQ